jgi:hypothetical protein
VTKRVLAIGIDPIFIDFRDMPGLTPELIRAFIDSELDRLRGLDYQVESCLIDLGETAEHAVSAALRSRAFDCIVMGAGLRQPPERLLLFERVLNLVHRLAPKASIAFNTTPADTCEAAQRWL